MICRRLLSGLIIFALIFPAGCAPKRERTWVDLSTINEEVVRGGKPTTTLEGGQLKEEGEAAAAPRAKDLSSPGGNGNPYLSGVKPAPELTVAGAGAADGILLNFDNADIYEVIEVIAATLNINYIIDPQVKGVVNIRSGEKIPLGQLFVIFKKILNINGLDIRNEGDYYFVYPSKSASALSVYGPDQTGTLKDSPRMVMQIIPIMHLASSEAVKLIEPYLSAQGSVFNMDSHNILIVNDFESKVIDTLSILSRLDVSPLATLRVRLIRIEKAPLFDLRDELREVLGAMGINKKEFESVSVIPLERVSSLLLVSKNDQLLDSVDGWVKELDVIPTQGRDSLSIYNVRNSVASDLVELVTSLISEQSADTKKTESKTTTKDTEKKEPNAKSTPKSTKKTTTKTKTGVNAPVESLRFAGEPALFADDTRNVILIRALPADYSRLVKLLEKLDNLPRQVLIEVMVAEVQLSETFELGIEWALKNNKLKINDSVYKQTVATSGLGLNTSGLSYSVFNSVDDVVGLLNALATDNDVSIMSSPQILVLNNEEAEVNVGDQVPIVTSSTQRETIDTDLTQPIVDKTIQYKDTGTILTVTPRINYNGMIILDINQEVSSVAAGLTTEGVNSPTIATRKLKTKLAVKDGQSILMGGLIKKDVNMSNTGVPLLKDIPGLGWLFKYQKETTTKTELMVMITPYVIESEDVLDQYLAQFKEKMDGVRKEFKVKEGSVGIKKEVTQEDAKEKEPMATQPVVLEKAPQQTLAPAAPQQTAPQAVPPQKKVPPQPESPPSEAEPPPAEAEPLQTAPQK